MRKITQLLLFVCVVSLTASCDAFKVQYNNITEIETVTGAMMLDNTDKGLADMPFETVYQYWNRVIPDAGSVYTTIITNKATNKEAIAVKKPITLFEKATWAKNEIEAHENKFKNDLEGNYTSLKQPLHSYNKSYVYSTIREVLHRLVNSEGKKHLIAFTDGIENSHSVSFYKRKRRPDTLIENQKEVLKKLEKSFGQLPDNLSGVEIVFIHEPEYRLDRLFSATKDWWRITLEERGAQVRFQTILN